MRNIGIHGWRGKYDKGAKVSLSICIICYNEEDNIKRCLESVLWADDIVVVDAMSIDKTIEIANRYTDRVYKNPWPGYAAQKNFALSKATERWVFSIDSDEEISPALREEILEITEKSDGKNGYRVPRLSFYQGRWIKHSGFYPDRQLRLFKKEKSRWVGGRVHERIEVDGEVGELKNDLLHYPYQGTISGLLTTIDEFAGLKAQDMYDKGKRYSTLLLLLRPIVKFFEVYLLKLGFLDGVPGLIIAVSSAFTLFVRYVKLREIEMR